MHSPFPDVHLPLFVARLQSINLSISSARSSASHQSSSSNSRMELLLAGLYSLITNTSLEGRRFALIAVNC